MSISPYFHAHYLKLDIENSSHAEGVTDLKKEGVSEFMRNGRSERGGQL